MNAGKTKKLADSMYPGETWVHEYQGEELGDHIRLAASAINSKKDTTIRKEIAQARLLAAIGAIIYILPEGDNGDAIVNGLSMEFKTITGGFKKIERHFRKSIKQNQNVFLYLNPQEEVYDILDVRKKIGQIIKEKAKKEGLIIINNLGKFYFWDVKDFW